MIFPFPPVILTTETLFFNDENVFMCGLSRGTGKGEKMLKTEIFAISFKQQIFTRKFEYPSLQLNHQAGFYNVTYETMA